MILEGFEIENWSCIRKVTVSGLPPTGVIVLHGPNRRGKSSIVQALRACLMDYSSTTTALKSCYPRGTAEKPVVTVTFRSNGTSYRIKKHFGSNKSELASKTSAGAWKVESITAAEAHDRTCVFAGGTDSAKGLHQVLWLTQAEFRLPDPRKFDANVQAQLRGVLGVLQTPLDDRFIERVKKRWSVWFSGQRKAGKQHEIKDGCKLAENLAKLEAGQKELQESESKFSEVESLLRQSSNLEQEKLDLERQFGLQSRELSERQEEHLRSQTRIMARQQAVTDHASAVKERDAALEEQRLRAEAARRAIEDDNAIAPAQSKVEAAEQKVKATEHTQADRRRTLGQQREERRELQQRANRIAAKLRALDDSEKLNGAQDILNRARKLAEEIAEIEKYLSENPVPEKVQLDALKTNRQRSTQLQADRDAASMNLTLTPERGAGAAQLSIDGGSLRALPNSATITESVRRKAELIIDGWGRLQLSRGTGHGDLDQIEEDLRQCNDEFANAVAPFGIATHEADALDKLLLRDAEYRLKSDQVDRQKKELKKLAPKGLEPLQKKVIELQTKLTNVPSIDEANAEPLPAAHADLEKLATNLKQQIENKDSDIQALESELDAAESKLNSERKQETAAKELLSGKRAKAKGSREELDRFRTEELIATSVKDAVAALERTQTQLQQTELTHEENTINERLEAAQGAVNGIEQQIRENTRKYDVIKGRLLESEGLHARRSALAARVDELTRLTESQSLEKDAIDRLYALFEECREKQLGALMGPIHDRVLGWMRVLDIGDYKAVRFNDAFLPDKLMSRDGTAEFTLDEESTGAQEQIGMFVRLALGSTLASVSEPAIAILDDPLTHCDRDRLNKMRVILRRAAEGDPMLTPPAGPLQIVILTCHPEWFRDERATVIDLENPEIMIRSSV